MSYQLTYRCAECHHTITVEIKTGAGWPVYCDDCKAKFKARRVGRYQ